MCDEGVRHGLGKLEYIIWKCCCIFRGKTLFAHVDILKACIKYNLPLPTSQLKVGQIV